MRENTVEDDLTAAYMAGYEKGRDARLAAIARAEAAERALAELRSAPIDVGRLAVALHFSATNAHLRRECSDRHDIRAEAIATVYARLAPSPAEFERMTPAEFHAYTRSIGFDAKIAAALAETRR